MRTNAYLWTAGVAELALTLLGAVVALSEDWAKSHRIEVLVAFVAIGGCAMFATAKYAERSSSEVSSLLTGGNTFCYFDVLGQQFPLTVGNVRKNGEGPLYNVKMKLQALVPAAGGGGAQLGRGRINCLIGDLPASNRPAFGDIPLSSFNLKDQDSVDFDVAFEAKNGYWNQKLCLRKADGRWVRATKVFRIDYGVKLYGQAKSKPIFEDIPADFPPANISWSSNSLLYH